MIDTVKHTTIRQSFRVVDYEVAVNYGRSGKKLEAALPTSLDLRMSEQKTDDKGATWVDDGPTLVRNLAVKPKTEFADGNQPDRTEAPDNEASFDAASPLLAPKDPIGRIRRSVYADIGTVRERVIEQPRLHHFTDHKLISDQIEDPSYRWTQDTLGPVVRH